MSFTSKVIARQKILVERWSCTPAVGERERKEGRKSVRLQARTYTHTYAHAHAWTHFVASLGRLDCPRHYASPLRLYQVHQALGKLAPLCLSI